MLFKSLIAAALLVLNVSATPVVNVPRTVAPVNITQFLDAHNTERALHGAAPLTWNNTLADKAEDTAELCLYKHTNTGQNLALGYSTSSTYFHNISSAVKQWTHESAYYDPTIFMSNVTGKESGHWTQVVWKNTKSVGCAYKVCPRGSAGVAEKYKTIWYYVCNYYPAGNVTPRSKYYPLNVQP